MKRIIYTAVIALAMTACNNANTADDTLVDQDTITTTNTTTTTTAYVPAEGDVTYRNGTLMQYRNGDWVAAENDVTLDNDIVVYKNGEVKKETKTVTLNDGEVVTRTGNFFDKTGEAIEDGWDATKRGVKKAGDAIKDASKDAKESIDREFKQ